MQKRFSTIMMLSIFLCQSSYADPWFTGPLLAIAAQNEEPGHFSGYINTGIALSDNIYDQHWALVDQQHYSTSVTTSELSWGLTDKVDVQYDFIYKINQHERRSYEHIGDTVVTLGYQALTQKQNHGPDLRLIIQEILPTGLYNQLTPILNGVEATGSGSYQTLLGINLQYLSQLTPEHYLNSHLNIGYNFPGDVSIQGLSVYGGTSATRGTINPGNSVNIDIAEELSLTQNWAVVIEANFNYQRASSFRGTVGTRQAGDPSPVSSHFPYAKNQFLPTKFNIGNPEIGSGNQDQITLAPAIEYNMSENFGVISGVWLTVAGKNTIQFIMPTIQFNAAW